MSLANQLFTLLGVIVGASASYLATALTESARWRRSLSVRWDKHRLGAYVAYTNAIKRNAMVVAQILAGEGIVKTIKPLDRPEGLADLAAVETERSTGFEAVVLLADTETIGAGLALNSVMWKMQAFARGEHPITAEVWRETFLKYREARGEFYAAARRSMGVPAANVPAISAWLQALETDVS
jgi:hypothetical protein